MNKYVFNILYNLLSEIKAYDKYENLNKIKAILNNEIPGFKCLSVSVNDSTTASSFYGIIVYPKFGERSEKSINAVDNDNVSVGSYAIEIQKQAIDLFNPRELAAYIIHDISHNVLSSTVNERLKLAIIHACRMTKMKVVDVTYNTTVQMKELAVIDIANRTYKVPVVPGTDMYEPDRLLIDMDIWNDFNSALEKMASIDYINLSAPDDQQISDTHMGTKIVKMVRERLRYVCKTYDELRNYIKYQYDTKILDAFCVPTINIMGDYRYGAEVLDTEELKPFELQMLQEGVIHGIKKSGKSDGALMIIESVFGSGRMNYSAIQKELDVINFKIDSVGSNYERLSILNRIYDNIFSLEKYLEKNSDDKLAWDFLKKFVDLTSVLKDAKVSKKRYGVFVEVPAGYEG